MSHSHFELHSSNVKHAGWILAAILLFYAALEAGTLHAIYPLDDEAYFASPAFNLALKGFFGTTVLDGHGPRWKGLSQATYWCQPLHGLLLAGWARLFGATLWSQRSLSALFGALDLCAWFLIVRALTARASPALVAVGLLAIDNALLRTAGLGRMDMMTAALGHSALAAYLMLRGRSLERALLSAFSLVVLAGLTHPLGGILSFLNLTITVIFLDRPALRWKHAAISAVPFLVGGLAWGAYIAQHPSWFLAQFTANAHDIDVEGTARLSGFQNPFLAMYRFARNILVYEYGDGGRFLTRTAMVKLSVPAVYAFALAAALCVKSLRRSRELMLLILLLAADFATTAMIEARLKVQYFFHVLILMPVLMAMLREYWRKTAFTAACIVLALVQGSRAAHALWQNSYRANFAPSVAVLQQPPYRGTDLWATAEFAYAAGFDHVVEDGDYGLFSHRRPRFIVIPNETYANALKSSEYKRHILTVEYTIRLQDARIVILERVAPGPYS
jgi:4-amino-4-deoxy-L-arabinose transferase-like glycosyltransferase